MNQTRIIAYNLVGLVIIQWTPITLLCYLAYVCVIRLHILLTNRYFDGLHYILGTVSAFCVYFESTKHVYIVLL